MISLSGLCQSTQPGLSAALGDSTRPPSITRASTGQLWPLVLCFYILQNDHTRLSTRTRLPGADSCSPIVRVSRRSAEDGTTTNSLQTSILTGSHKIQRALGNSFGGQRACSPFSDPLRLQTTTTVSVSPDSRGGSEGEPSPFEEPVAVVLLTRSQSGLRRVAQ